MALIEAGQVAAKVGFEHARQHQDRRPPVGPVVNPGFGQRGHERHDRFGMFQWLHAQHLQHGIQHQPETPVAGRVIPRYRTVQAADDLIDVPDRPVCPVIGAADPDVHRRHLC